MAVLWGLLYVFFDVFPIVCQKGKEWHISSTGLMFIPLIVGIVKFAALSPLKE